MIKRLLSVAGKLISQLSEKIGNGPAVNTAAPKKMMMTRGGMFLKNST